MVTQIGREPCRQILANCSVAFGALDSTPAAAILLVVCTLQTDWQTEIQRISEQQILF